MTVPAAQDAARLDAALTHAGVVHLMEWYPAQHGFAVTDNAPYDAAAAVGSGRRWRTFSARTCDPELSAVAQLAKRANDPAACVKPDKRGEHQQDDEHRQPVGPLVRNVPPDEREEHRTEEHHKIAPVPL